MGDKLNSFRLVQIMFSATIGLYLIYLVKKSVSNPQLLIPIIGLLSIFTGNYFPTLKQNNLIGVRTSWTIKDVNI